MNEKKKQLRKKKFAILYQPNLSNELWLAALSEQLHMTKNGVIDIAVDQYIKSLQYPKWFKKPKI